MVTKKTADPSSSAGVSPLDRLRNNLKLYFAGAVRENGVDQRLSARTSSQPLTNPPGSDSALVSQTQVLSLNLASPRLDLLNLGLDVLIEIYKQLPFKDLVNLLSIQKLPVDTNREVLLKQILLLSITEKKNLSQIHAIASSRDPSFKEIRRSAAEILLEIISKSDDIDALLSVCTDNNQTHKIQNSATRRLSNLDKNQLKDFISKVNQNQLTKIYRNEKLPHETRDVAREQMNSILSIETPLDQLLSFYDNFFDYYLEKENIPLLNSLMKNSILETFDINLLLSARLFIYKNLQSNDTILQEQTKIINDELINTINTRLSSPNLNVMNFISKCDDINQLIIICKYTDLPEEIHKSAINKLITLLDDKLITEVVNKFSYQKLNLKNMDQLNLIKNLKELPVHIKSAAQSAWYDLTIDNSIDLDFIRNQLEDGADPNQVNTKGESILDCFFYPDVRNQIEAIDILIEYGARFNNVMKPRLLPSKIQSRNNQLGLPAQNAIFQGNVKLLDAFLRAEGDPNWKDIREETLLYEVMRSINPSTVKVEMINLLIKAGADLDRTDFLGENYLHKAVKSGNNDLLKALIAAGVDLNKTDDSGKKPLDHATGLAESGNENFVAILATLQSALTSQ